MTRVFIVVVFASFMATGAGWGFERPRMQLQSPPALEAGIPIRYAHVANMLVTGEVSPPIGNVVTVSIYNLADDGGEARVISATTPLTDGKFNIDLRPAAEGWRPGRLRIRVVLGAMKQVHATVDLSIVRPEAALVRGPSPPPEDSEIFVDLEKAGGTTVQVPASGLFYVKGRFEQEGVVERIEGPSVHATIQRDAAGDSPGVLMHTGSSVSLREAEGKSAFEYEVQIQAPKTPGIYRVIVRSTKAMVSGEFLIDVGEPKK